MEGEYKKGLWTAEEDGILMDYIRVHGKGRWNRISKLTGLKRRGKSCRLRWINYLSPSVKRDEFSEQEDDLIIRLHNLLGNRWSLIAGRLPGRTDNQVKNYWNIHLSKKLGIRKRKLRVGSPSESLSVQEQDKGGRFSVSPPGLRPDYSSPKSGLDCTTIGIEGENVNNVGSERVAGFDGTDDASIMNGSYERSSWILNDDLGLCVPTLLEPLDDYSFDFIWNTF